MSDARKAAIHDLGYQRYVGTRKPQRTRYQVIVRNLVGMSWQGWWRYKMPLAIAAILVLSVINILGVKPGSRLLNVLVVLKVAALVVLIGAGVAAAALTDTTGFAFDLRSSGAAVVLSNNRRPLDEIALQCGQPILGLDDRIPSGFEHPACAAPRRASRGARKGRTSHRGTAVSDPRAAFRPRRAARRTKTKRPSRIAGTHASMRTAPSTSRRARGPFASKEGLTPLAPPKGRRWAVRTATSGSAGTRPAAPDGALAVRSNLFDVGSNLFAHTP